MKTLVALFDTYSDAQNAVQQLLDAGYNGNDVSLVASDADRRYAREHNLAYEGNDDAVGAGATGGAVVGGVIGLLAGLGALAIPGIGPVIAAGPLLSTLAGAGIGAATGGILGALVDAGVPEEDARYYTEGVRRGGTLVSVAVDDARVKDASDILGRNGALNIDSRVANWRERGWTGYDAAAQPLTSAELEAERAAYTERPVGIVRYY